MDGRVAADAAGRLLEEDKVGGEAVKVEPTVRPSPERATPRAEQDPVVPGADTIGESIDAEETAYKESVQLRVPQIAGYLLSTIGQRLTAFGVGLSDARPVRGWQEGKEIRDENSARLRLLYRVARTIALVYDEQTARAFLRSSSPYLEDKSPAALIAEGDEARVIEALRLFLEG